jgi:TPR repeat protein
VVERYLAAILGAAFALACAGRGSQVAAAGAVAGSGCQSAIADAPTTNDEAACAQGVGEACFRLGEQATGNQDPAGQLKYYMAACNAHVGLACVYLGQSIEPDSNKRAEWLKQSSLNFESGCNRADAESCYYLGIALERGVGLAMDATRARKVYATGCQLGSIESCTNEAGLHLQGKGTPKDLARAATIYAGACESRDERACYWLGAIHEQELGLLEDQSHVQKVASAELGVELRVMDAQLPIRSSPANSGPAIAVLLALDPKQLIEQCGGDQPLACYQLGIATQVGGARFPKDDRKAVAYYERACSLGSGWGCLRAGDCFERAYGVPADFAKASKYFFEVCERGVGGLKLFESECAGIGERMGF